MPAHLGMILEVPGVGYDESKIEDAVLALLATFSFDGGRSWKGFDFEIMNRLHARDFIDNPAGKNKSVWLTPRVSSAVARLPSGFFRPTPAMLARSLCKADASREGEKRYGQRACTRNNQCPGIGYRSIHGRGA